MVEVVGAKVVEVGVVEGVGGAKVVVLAMAVVVAEVVEAVVGGKVVVEVVVVRGVSGWQS